MEEWNRGHWNFITGLVTGILKHNPHVLTIYVKTGVSPKGDSSEVTPRYVRLLYGRAKRGEPSRLR